jgi:hypothetical protein
VLRLVILRAANEAGISALSLVHDEHREKPQPTRFRRCVANDGAITIKFCQRLYHVFADTCRPA